MNSKKDLSLICSLLHRQGLVSGSDGNISMKTGEDSLMATPSKVNKGFLTEDMIITVDFAGNLIEGNGKVTSELGMHSLIYRMKSNIGAVIHTHAPYATAFAVCGEIIPDNLLIEIPVIIGKIGLADFAIPGTQEVVKAIEPHIENCNVILLKNHGVVTYGKDIFEAYNRLEALENAAKTIIMAKMYGNPIEIDTQTIEKMYKKS